MKLCLPIIHRGSHLGPLFELSTRGSRTFRVLPAKMSAEAGGGSCLNTAPQLSLPLPRAEDNYQEERTDF